MRAIDTAFVLTGLSLLASTCTDDGLERVYFEILDAQVCAKIDPKSDPEELALELARTVQILELAKESGLREIFDRAEQRWTEIDSYSDKACPFQSGTEFSDTDTSLFLYREVNDDLESAIAAEIN